MCDLSVCDLWSTCVFFGDLLVNLSVFLISAIFNDDNDQMCGLEIICRQ